MITIQGTGQTALEAGYGAQQNGQPLYVDSHSWKRMTEKFLKGEPKILGIVQIVIAIMNLSIGLMMIGATVSSGEILPISVYIGYPIWGSIMFIISGSFSIVAGRRTTKGLVRSSLGLNITSSVFAFAGMIINSLSPSIYSFHVYFCTYRSTSEGCRMTLSILMGLDIVVVILSVLEFCIGISLSAYGCRVMCCNPGGVVIIMPSKPPMPETAYPVSLQSGLGPPEHQQKNVPGKSH
ncbi:membrane-spanning 4-domains subfamily A member 4A isoform X1 [Rattus norvegicus]|uniref:Membrane spanning 4-domains A4A n=2 Tax=Rattus norvegicus TaxID=10116 RepID=M0R3W2_RAT|nr:membrane-spanning 4-domains subfamily A member 4A isoform X1 [Rattus norvegicus]|eukprot:XP_006231147.1 PREDICTED: membrane-spanning 4-domains subfamily A member 4A isoform X1 [Rattus norvegicus]